MSTSLLDAIKSLDITNDEHWTQDSLPRLDVLSSMVGDKVTRAQIFEISKTFNRINPSLETETENEELETSNGDLEKTDAEKQTLELSSTQTGDLGNEELQAPDDVQANELDPEQVAELNLKKARLNLAKAQNAYKVAQEESDKFRLIREKQQQVVPVHNMIRAYQQSQAKSRSSEASRVAQLQSIASSLSGEEASLFKNGLNDML